MAPLVATHNCHAFAAGFDLAGEEAVERTMALFDQCVGYDRLKVVHLNDSKGALGSNLDRHELVGKGKIGVRGMKAILHYKGMIERPLIMETPFADTRAMKLGLATVRRLMD
jgi:deoxyribonuclease-4